MEIRSKKQLNNIIIFSIILPVAIALHLYAFLYLIMGIGISVQILNFLPNFWISQLFYLTGFVITLIGFLSFTFINKSNWPIIDGKIVNSEVVWNPLTLSFLKIWTIRHTVAYSYNRRNFTGKFYENIDFRTQLDGFDYLAKLQSNQEISILIYVFKYYPKFSALTKKNSIYVLFYFYVILLSNIIFLFFGLLYRIAGTNDLLPIAMSSDQNYVYAQIKNIFINYSKNFNVITLLIPIITMLLLLLVIIKASKLLITNKLYMFYPKINVEIENIHKSQVNLFEKHCLYCNISNEIDAKFCSNCGKLLVS